MTRDEWMEMWHSIKHMESQINNEYVTLPYIRSYLQDEINKIKQQIQSVIGQME